MRGDTERRIVTVGLRAVYSECKSGSLPARSVNVT
jgi:hypothetical protein